MAQKGIEVIGGHAPPSHAFHLVFKIKERLEKNFSGISVRINSLIDARNMLWFYFEFAWMGVNFLKMSYSDDDFGEVFHFQGASFWMPEEKKSFPYKGFGEVPEEILFKAVLPALKVAITENEKRSYRDVCVIQHIIDDFNQRALP